MTAIPAAIDHLIARCTVSLESRQIIDGPPLVNLEKAGVAIGYSPDELSVTSTEEGAGLQSDVETFDINCIAWQRSGDEDAKTVRDQVFATVADVGSILAADRRLGGTVVHARLRVVELDQTQNPDGTWAVVAFAITCKAFK